MDTSGPPPPGPDDRIQAGPPPEPPAEPDGAPLIRRSKWLDLIVLTEDGEKVPAHVLAAFALALLSVSLSWVPLFCLPVAFCLWADVSQVTGYALLIGVPVHPAALIAGLVARGVRPDGPRAAWLAVLFGALGTVFFTVPGVLWWLNSAP